MQHAAKVCLAIGLWTAALSGASCKDSCIGARQQYADRVAECGLEVSEDPNASYCQGTCDPVSERCEGTGGPDITFYRCEEITCSDADRRYALCSLDCAKAASCDALRGTDKAAMDALFKCQAACSQPL